MRQPPQAEDDTNVEVLYLYGFALKNSGELLTAREALAKASEVRNHAPATSARGHHLTRSRRPSPRPGRLRAAADVAGQ
jgi:hypothetical protein